MDKVAIGVLLLVPVVMGIIALRNYCQCCTRPTPTRRSNNAPSACTPALSCSVQEIATLSLTQRHWLSLSQQHGGHWLHGRLSAEEFHMVSAVGVDTLNKVDEEDVYREVDRFPPRRSVYDYDTVICRACPMWRCAWARGEVDDDKQRSVGVSWGCIGGVSPRRSTSAKRMGRWLQRNRVEFLAGITTGLTAVPTAVAFAVLANVEPAIGLRGTWIIMLIMATFGGRTGMIYSNSGSMGVILESAVRSYGVGHMFQAFITAGIIQIVLGFLGVAKLLRLLPVSVMIGFVNGLAIVLLLAQVKNFQDNLIFGQQQSTMSDAAGGRRLATSFDVFGEGNWLTGAELAYTCVVAVLTAATVVGMTWIARGQDGMKVVLVLVAHIVGAGFVTAIPPILIGLMVAIVAEHAIIRGGIGSATKTLGEVAEISGNLPTLVWLSASVVLPPYNIGEVLPTAISLLAVGLVESLMTVRLVDEILDSTSNIHLETVMGGVGNFVAGAFGGQGGNSEIGLTMVNLKSGGSNRIAGVTSALLVLLVILVASPLLNLVPMAGLVGIMVVIAVNTFDWSSISLVVGALVPRSQCAKITACAGTAGKRKSAAGCKRCLAGHRANLPQAENSVLYGVDEEADNSPRTASTSNSTPAVAPAPAKSHMSRPDALIIIVVTIVTPFTNLAIAVGCGVGLALLAFAWQSSNQVVCRSYICSGLEVTDPPVIKVYEVTGSIFFGSTEQFLALFDHRHDPAVVEVHLHHAFVCDYSAAQAINTLGVRYTSTGRHLRFRRLRSESARVIKSVTDAASIPSDTPECLMRGRHTMSEMLRIELDDDTMEPPLPHQLWRTSMDEGEIMRMQRMQRSRAHSGDGQAVAAASTADAAVVCLPRHISCSSNSYRACRGARDRYGRLKSDVRSARARRVSRQVQQGSDVEELYASDSKEAAAAAAPPPPPAKRSRAAGVNEEKQAEEFLKPLNSNELHSGLEPNSGWTSR
ncbi:sulfate transporter family-domain-containing protein [Tribonema minus]|uniref:Sulfate transporter family-domain-containing protein n=1 Tax=Tribonema minus TaxID=303371 RepID=A0A835Z2G9_9STRA|nr:sulfate transporter family-domain-containing protein [Tribonema minus]